MKRKRNQRKRKPIDDGEGEEEDRISRLPDSILHKILSSMDDLVSAIETCVLSKRSTLPNLRFDFDQFLSHQTDAYYDTTIPRFTCFLNQVLSNLCRFYFSSDYFVDQCLVKKCICYAVCHNVQQLHVGAFCFPTPYEFPRCFINCGSLKQLKLVYCEYNSMPWDTPLGLPGLKTLDLHRFAHGSSNFITQTVANCPNLETLILDYLYLECLNINAPQLRKLELCYQRHSISESYESKICDFST
ncbi:putative F-box/LRR-repeat protein [Camellia lanceoleosa]|uniref:F-box/LRR-repeat protein n=1 Tax=Camellia lanceoleosa TaxID=1840588 RepID=A0ACC0GNV5_9ERIC|nr:putative F-box/LRR-repeat protein [Camellia lanceoleosa]